MKDKPQEKNSIFRRKNSNLLLPIALHHILLYGDDVNLLREKVIRLVG